MNSKITSNLTILLVILAYMFSLLMRYILVYHMQGDASLIWNEEFLLISPDGYTYAEGARDIITGNLNNISSRVTAPLSILTAFLVKVLPFSIDTIIFHMSAFLSSLIVIPVFFITKRFGSNYLAFAAAIFSSIVVSYYERTMIGYYDTDMLIIVLPMFIYWFIIESLENKNRLFALYAVVTGFLFAWWLPSNIALNLSIVLMLVIYTLLYDRKSLFNYFLAILLFIAALPIVIVMKAPALLAVFILLYFHNKLNVKITFLGLFILSIVILLVSYNLSYFDLILHKVAYYFNKGNDFDNGLYFIDSGSFVQEVANISYVDLSFNMSGNMFTFAFALLGYIFMALRYRIMILFLPMLLLGAMSYGIPGLIPSAGQRFSFYATPVLAISLMYAIIWLSSASKKHFHKNIKLRYILFILVLLPNINHIINYQLEPFLKNRDIKALDQLNKTTSREDYVVSWWDYGYYLKYYSQTKTVCDGGGQLGKILYPISYLFMSQSQTVSAQLAQMISHEVDKGSGLNYVKMMMNRYGYTDTSLFFRDLNKNKIPLKQDKFDTYIYIPKSMIDLYRTMNQFSQINLKTGEALKNRKTFHLSKEPIIFKNNNIIYLGKGISYIKEKEEVYFKSFNISSTVKTVIKISYNQQGNINIHRQNTPHRDGYIIIQLDDGRVILADDAFFNSTLIQLGLFQNYDSNLFEAVELSADAKIYRIKK